MRLYAKSAVLAFREVTAAIILLGITSAATARIIITPSTVSSLLGTDKTGAMVYLINDQVYYINFSESSFTERRVSSRTAAASPLISPDGKLVTFSCVYGWGTACNGSNDAEVFVCRLQENATAVKIADGFDPHWWIDPGSGKTYIIYKTEDCKNYWPLYGQTRKQEINPSTLAPVGGYVTVIDKGFGGGMSKSGRWLCSAYSDVVLYDLVNNSVYILNGGAQGCNASITPTTTVSRENRMMHLDGGHQNIVVRDNTDAVIWSVARPASSTEWDVPEWSTDENFCTAIAKIGTESHTFIVRMSDKRVEKVRDGNSFCPHLWIGPKATPPALSLNPASLTYSAMQGGANPANQTVNVTNSGGGTLNNVTATENAAWLTVTQGGSGNSQTLTNAISIEGLAAGTYTTSVSVAAANASNTPVSYTVTLTVTAAPVPPSLALSPTALTYSAMQGGANPANQTVNVTNSGGGTLNNVTATENAAWLTVTQGGSGNSQTLANAVSIGGLAAGTYTTSVSVSSSNASNSPMTYDITLTVIAMREPDNVTGLVPGLDVFYYELNSPQSLSVLDQLSPYGRDTAENINYAQTSAEFATSGKTDNLGARFIGFVEADQDGIYTFSVSSDDGAALYIGDIKVVDNDGLHPMQEVSRTIGLKAGKHAFAVAFFEAGGEAGLVVKWSLAGGNAEVIPASSFFRYPASFSISSPADGEEWMVGTTQHIQWTAQNVEKAVIEYSLDGGLSYQQNAVTVSKSDANWGDYPWVVPDTPSGDCRIRISDSFGKGIAVSQPFIIISDATSVDKEKRHERRLSWSVTISGSVITIQFPEDVRLPGATGDNSGRHFSMYDNRGRIIAYADDVPASTLLITTGKMAEGVYMIRAASGGKIYRKTFALYRH